MSDAAPATTDRASARTPLLRAIAAVALVALVGYVALAPSSGAGAPQASSPEVAEAADGGRVLAASTDAFDAWVVKYGREYFSKEERAMRREVFYANLATIEAHNAGNHGWTMGLGEFTDLTADEFQKARLSGYVPEPALRRRIAAIRTERVTAATGRSLRSSASLQAEAHLGAPVPGPVPTTSLDWTTTRNPKAKVAVSAVQDQGSCVAGWAFAATGAIEGNGALFTSPTGAAPLLNLLAVQQMKGCASKSFACAGGRTQDGLQWAINNAGQCTAATYGPFSTANNTCMPASCQVAQSKIKSFTNCTTGNVPCMQAAVASKPVTVGVDGRSILLQHYTTGVINTTCTNNIEHVALVVGYGNWTNVARTPYWRIKNSWGNWWGDKGYFRVARGPSFDTMNGGFGVCGVYGIPMWPSY